MSTKDQEKLISILKQKTEKAGQKKVGEEIERILGCIPDSDKITQAMLTKALGAFPATKIIFSDEEGDFYKPGKPSNKFKKKECEGATITILKRPGNSPDMAHGIFFEMFNACQRKEYLASDLEKDPTKYGILRTKIEARTSEWNVTLLRRIKLHAKEKVFSKGALKTLNGYNGVTDYTGFYQTTLKSAHNSKATGDSSYKRLWTPQMYTYEKVLGLEKSQPVSLLKEILKKTYPGVAMRESAAYIHIGKWLFDEWKVTPEKCRPKLWLWAGQESTRVLQKKMKSKKVVDAKALHFTPQMVQKANVIGGAKVFSKCQL